MKRLFVLLPALILVLSLQARKVSLNDGWQFRKAEKADWKAINLPHTWNTDAYTEKNYHKGKALYRRTLQLNPEDSLRNFHLRFEGVSKAARVMVNGKEAGHHKAGYTAFSIPISEYLSFTTPNLIEVEVDNDRDEAHRRDMQLAKDMGANFIRIAHYPQDPAVLEYADRLGLLVWEEIPLIDAVPNDSAYANTAETNLREMITQHYNHPSVIMWGYMNEILLNAHRENPGDSAFSSVLDRTHKLISRLENVAKKTDPTRFTTMAFHGSDEYRKVGIAAVPDINGWNLYQGWYGGDLAGFEKFLSTEHRENPSKPIIVSEYGAGSDRRTQ